jgi:hypothetical protein
VADPYAAQLSSFTSSIPNARRGLIDLYKLRRKGIEAHYNELGTLYGAASAKTGQQYAASQDAIKGFGRQGAAFVGSSGYQTDNPDVRAAVEGILREGTSPFNAYLSSEGKAQRAMFKGLKEAGKWEDKTLKTGLAREQPAALSELEQGIIDTQTNLGTQSAAFQAQQNFQQQQQAYMNQMLAYQGQIAGAQGGQGGYAAQGGLSAAEQWIIQHESGSQGVTADNPTSTAFGLGQLLLSNRQKYAAQLGVSPSTTDYNAQLSMMRSYIRDRYGSAEAAMRFWQQHGWY